MKPRDEYLIQRDQTVQNARECDGLVMMVSIAP
jgi:hypothetical protein